ncbi:unnamed protein product [Lymnaea stagnalis]|uniref:SID1 transmembrane family member 1 n=1 Tax=Lymnaea stagnalis TaxID=6523 RepID=A0AAV2ICM5_LYMST
MSRHLDILWFLIISVWLFSCFCLQIIAGTPGISIENENKGKATEQRTHTIGVHEKISGVLSVSESYSASLKLDRHTINTFTVDAKFGESYSNYSVNKTTQVIFVYEYSEDNQTTAVRVNLKCSSASEDFPLMFVARQQESLLSWQIPLEIGDSYSYYSVSRTLCPIDKSHRQSITKDQLIYLSVSTMSNDSVGFDLSVDDLKDFEIEHEVSRSLNLSVSEPMYYMYTFPETVSAVLLKVTSTSHTCMTVSVQKIKCPVFDLETNVNFEGQHQTMSTQAAMFLEKDDFSELGGFYVVFIVKPNNEVCEGYLAPAEILPPGQSEKKKDVRVEIKETISSAQYYKATFAAAGVFLFFYLIAFAISVLYAKLELHKGLDDLTQDEMGHLYVHVNPNFPRALKVRLNINEHRVGTQANENNYLRRSNTSGTYGTISDTSESDRELSHVSFDQTSETSSVSLDESTIDFLPDADMEKEIFRTKTALFVSDLARKNNKKLSKTYKLYYWNLVTISIFYGLPVVQLVITYQRVLTATGNQDICYYNFACSHPFKSYLSSFNNVFSNIGYVMLGLLFILIVYRRDTLHKMLQKKHGDLEKHYGIPQHFGLFYAMGMALLMEGIMSACYHVCPNYSNFQFDTSFMYIIACLNMLKIYQFRHPDINAKAHTAYFSMAVIIFIAVLGVVYGTSVLWIFYALIHMLMSLVLSAQVYYMGRWRFDRHIFKRLFRVILTEGRRCTRPIYPSRFILLLFGNLINWAFALYGAIKQPSDFATYLLAIFIGNLLLYCMFYIVMKLLYKESLSWLVILVILTSMVTWAGSLYFFFQNLTSWGDTPAGSRARNSECILMEFYDAHDVWHFLSAISLFFSFMILLLLDDDLSLKRRDKLPVF